MSCSVVILSCDKYEACWEPFFELKKKYWEDCEFDTFLVTETKECKYAKTININNQSWTYRFREALKQIETKYVIVMLDDFFIRSKVDNDRIMALFDSFNDHIACFNFEQAFILPCHEVYERGFKKRKNGTMYLNSCQPSLHDKNKLIERLQKNETAWDWELTIVNSPYEFYVNNGDFIIDIGYDHTLNWGVSRGKTTPECKSFLEKEGFPLNKEVF